MSGITAEGAAFWENAKKSMSPDLVAKIDAGIDAMVSGATPYTPIALGETVADFTLDNQNGQARSLSGALEKGPVILFFYRGEWCPFCNLQLKHYQESLARFNDAGASLIAISPEKPDHSIVAAEKHNLGFDILYDIDDAVGETFGVSVHIPDEHIDALKGFGLELPEWNGTQSWTLPVPGVFIIDRDFKVKWRFVEANYRIRAEVDEILAALATIKLSSV